MTEASHCNWFLCKPLIVSFLRHARLLIEPWIVHPVLRIWFALALPWAYYLRLVWLAHAALKCSVLNIHDHCFKFQLSSEYSFQYKNIV